MREYKKIRQFWANHSHEKLVLCTLVQKTGSAYRGPGAKKIVSLGGSSAGLLSGGCLEADIEKCARERWGQLPLLESFSTAEPQDQWLGYQTGCAGVIEILFEALPSQQTDIDLWLPFGPVAKAEGVRVRFEAGQKVERRFGVRTELEPTDVFFDPWVYPLRLTLIGAGLDAVPYTELVPPLGWDLECRDYRDAFRSHLPPDIVFRLSAAAELTHQLGWGPKTAVVIMTHNYAADLATLSSLVGTNHGYIGCLGPRARYDQLKNDLDPDIAANMSPEWESRVHAPAGIFGKGRTPEAIALSVIADIHKCLSHDEV